jgi:hypothetical protein
MVGRSKKRKQYWIKGKDEARDVICNAFEARDSYEAVATTPIPLRKGHIWSSNLNTPQTIDYDRSPSPSPASSFLRRRILRVTYPLTQVERRLLGICLEFAWRFAGDGEDWRWRLEMVRPFFSFR